MNFRIMDWGVNHGLGIPWGISRVVYFLHCTEKGQEAWTGEVGK